MTPQEVFERQQAHFGMHPNPPISHRRDRLRQLRAALLEREEALKEALWKDFSKPPYEVELTELLTTLIELDHSLRHLAQWMKPQRKPTPLVLIGTRTDVQCFPKGPSLIIAPWNYAVLLTLGPIIHATAAGCPFVVKPSEHTPHAADLLKELIESVYPPEEGAVMLGGPDIGAQLLEQFFSHIHFTGSPDVGRIIMGGAARHLASVTLELGGKSPTYVDTSADLEDAAKGICFGKFSNAGQTCIAPDYVLVHRSVADAFKEALTREIEHAYVPGSGDAELTAIVTTRHFERQRMLLEDASEQGTEVLIGGHSDAENRRIAATVLLNPPESTRVMQEEIFGPILPLVVVDSVEDAIERISRRPKPLSTYVYTRSDAIVDQFSASVRTGAVCMNTTMLQFVQPFGPFGGEGNSGIGRSHGEAGFRAFSNEQVVLRRRWGSWILRLVQPPYSPRTSWIGRIFRKFT
jgi:aldehyde dehydrogenase (NAD+)